MIAPPEKTNAPAVLLPRFLTAAMVSVVVSANVLVQFPISDWLTWGAATYPVSFLITDIANRVHGPAVARKVLYVGFFIAVILSAYMATVRIALASGTAFLIAQLLDVQVFDRLRDTDWWKAPLVSSFIGSAVDTALFFTIAFYGTTVPWVTLAIGDFLVKIVLALLMLVPFFVAYKSYLATDRSN